MYTLVCPRTKQLQIFTAQVSTPPENLEQYLAEMPDNLADYDTIFIGTPNWFNKVALPVATFLADNDFTGKTNDSLH